MDERSADDDSIFIKIPNAVWNKSAAESAPESTSAAVKKAGILDKTGLSVVIGKRNSDYGFTDVQSLAFANHEQRMQVLALFRNPALYDSLPDVLDYLFQMGRSTDAELRYFASLAAAELVGVVPFSEVKEGVIARWAKYGSSIVNRTAALALSKIISDERHRTNVLTLLKHWVDVRHHNLTGTALLTYSEVAFLYPEETLDAVQKIVVNEYSLSFVPTVITLSERLYRKQPELVIGRFYKWFEQKDSIDLAVFAAITFLAVADIRDFCGQWTAREYALNLAFALWEGPSVPQRAKLQELTGEAIHEWATTTLLTPADNPARALCVGWFHDLYGKCAATRQNRLEFYLKRWQMGEEVRVAKLNFMRKPESAPATMQDFSLLRPMT
jgi:hypothetical protein